MSLKENFRGHLMKLCFEVCGLVKYHLLSYVSFMQVFSRRLKILTFFAVIWELLSMEIFV